MTKSIVAGLLASLLFASPACSNEDVRELLPHGCVAVWDIGASTNWFDASGHGFHLTSSNAPARSGNRFNWSSTDTNFFIMDTRWSTNFTVPEFTIAFWFRSPSNTTTRGLFAVFRGGGEGYANQVGKITEIDYYEPGYWTNGSVRARTSDGTTDGQQQLSLHSQYTRFDDEQWHFWVSDVGTAGLSRLWIDGQSVTNVFSSPTPDDPTIPLTWPKKGDYDPTVTLGAYRQLVGAELKVYYPLFGGSVYRPMFWARRLTDEERAWVGRVTSPKG